MRYAECNSLRVKVNLKIQTPWAEPERLSYVTSFSLDSDKNAMSVNLSLPSTADAADEDGDEEEEPWEREVEDLVSWTKKLTTNGL